MPINIGQMIDDLYGYAMHGKNKRVAEAALYASGVLELRTPKKVVVAKMLHSGSSPMLCPECKAWVSAYQDYCSACGQALDWEVE